MYPDYAFSALKLRQVIRTFRHQWVYRESDKTVNPVFPNLREIYLPALECSAEQLANLLKILVAERGVETIVIDENALDFQRIRYSIHVVSD